MARWYGVGGGLKGFLFIVRRDLRGGACPYSSFPELKGMDALSGRWLLHFELRES